MFLAINITIYAFIFIYGIIIGSFLNVCIFRIPRHEEIVVESSHCMSCGHKLAWYDLFPVFSFIFLGGKCRYCKTKLSIQYPIVEALNGFLYMVVDWMLHLRIENLLFAGTFLKIDFFVTMICFQALTSVLIVITVIDERTFEIPFGCNVFIFVLGVIKTISSFICGGDWLGHLIGFFAISVFLTILYYLSKGRAIGGGDVKLMAAAGLLIGWKDIVLAFFVGCIIGSVIHIIRMKFSKKERVLAMGPYLSAGIFICMLWGDFFIDWYLRTAGFYN